MRPLPPLLCLLALATPAWGATETLGPYLGTLAKLPVAARFDASGNGRYFYRKSGRDIALIRQPGAAEDPRLRFLECPASLADADTPCDRPSGYWTVAITAEAVKGHWSKSADGKPQPIELQRVPDARGEEAVEARYQALRIEGRERRTLAAKSAGPVAWKTVQDAGTRLAMPFLTQAPDAAALARINAALETSFRRQIRESLEAAEYNADNAVLFANPRYFAVGGDTAYYFQGAAHPSGGFSATTYDLHSGQEVRWAAFFRIADGAELDLNRKDLLAALALRRARSAAEQDKDSDCMGMAGETYGCEGPTCRNAGEIGDDPAWILYPREQGLAVDFDIYPEVARVCRGESIVIPWAELGAALRKPMPLP